MASNKTYDSIDRPYSSSLERTDMMDASSSKLASSLVGGSGGPEGAGGDIIVENPTETTSEIVSGQSFSDLWIESWIKSRNYSPRTKGFLIDGKEGYIECMKLFVGAGGIVGGTLDVPNDVSANSFHVDANGNTWWGANNADWLLDHNNAPAYILNTGVAKFQNVTITGGSVSGVPISNIPNDALTDISLLDMTHNLVFSSSSATVVAWASGTITMSNGRTFSISAGNTGTMSAKTYIYLDTAVSSIVLQTTTTASSAMGANRKLIGVAQNGPAQATFTIYDGIGGIKLGASSTSVSNNNWAFSGTWTVTSASVISWGAGTLTTSDGGSYSISASNTGTMSAKTYIYFNLAVSSTAFQTTTTQSTAVGDGKILIAIAQNGTGEATFIVVNDPQSNINASQIVAGSITANEIQAGSITASLISVSQLSAISADMGSITAGTITLNSVGNIKSGQTAYDTGTGFWLGYSSGAKFSLGNSAGNKMTWDGSTLSITGVLTATTGVVGGFEIGTDYIRDVADSFGLASTVTGGDDVRFWAGSSFASRATAPLRITEAGVIFASSATISGALTTAAGSSINGTYLTPSSVEASKVNNSIQSWSLTSVFSSSSSTVVAWAAGSLIMADGTTYSISSGNTGTMSSPTYIYLDVAISSTVLQTTTVATTAVGSGKVLVATANNNATGRATFQVFGGLGGTFINASSTDINLQDWNLIMAFSVNTNSTPQQLDWAAGTLIMTNGTSYSISAGNTGTMTGRNYIYFQPSVSTTAFQVTTTATAAVGNGKLLVATAIATATAVTTYNVLGGIGGFKSGVGSLPISGQDWNCSCVFSAASAVQVNWAGGFLLTSDFTTYTISAGNTGTMSSETYIYFDPAVSTTTFQTTTALATAFGNNKILIGKAKNNTNEAIFYIRSGRADNANIDGASIVTRSLTANEIVAGTITANEIAANTITAGNIVAGTITATQIAAGTITATQIAAATITASNIQSGTITATQIAASTITGGNIAANTVTASNMTVATLSAISADLGTITAGTITLPSGGYIRSGMTAYQTGTGFYLGNDSGTPKFSIGSSTQYLTWDGSTLTVTGVSIINAPTTTLMTIDDTYTNAPLPIFIQTSTYTPTIIAEQTGSSASGVSDKIYGVEWKAQTFKTSRYDMVLYSVKTNLARDGAPTGNITVSIYAVDSNGVPTGSSLGSASMAVASIATAWTTFTEYEFVMGTPVAITKNTRYAIVYSGVTGDASNNVRISTTTNAAYWISDGEVCDSSNSGSTWSNQGGTVESYFKVYAYSNIPLGNISVVDSEFTNKVAYTGFLVQNSIAASQSRIQFNGIVNNLTGLSVGSTYYLNSSLRVINQSVSAGYTDFGNTTNAQKIGQTFLYSSSNNYKNTLQKIVVNMQYYGTLTDGVDCKLYASDKTTLLATAQGFNYYSINTTGLAVTFVFPTPYELVSGTTYFIEFSRTGTLHVANRYGIKMNTSDVYAGGSMWRYDGSVWNNTATDDLFFDLYVNPIIHTSPGTNSVKVGRAVSSTDLLIYQLSI